MVRRLSFTLAMSLMLPGCVTATTGTAEEPIAAAPAEPTGLYGAITDEPFAVAALDTGRIDPKFRRQEVDYVTVERPGTIVVDPNDHFLYLVETGGRAWRYGVAVGKEGSTWSGVASVKTKQAWPDWYPTPEMLERRPDIKDMLGPLKSGPGIAGGLDNPIGARALYLWQGNKDTLYRIHGTTEPYSIGKSVSSGCIRMTNQDVIDLYARVSVGTTVKVLPTTPVRTAS